MSRAPRTRRARDAAPLPPLWLDVTRLLGRIRAPQLLTGVDRVSLAYLRWVRSHGGELCLRRGTRLVRADAVLTRYLEDAAERPRPPNLRERLHLHAPHFGSRHEMSIEAAAPVGTVLLNTAHSWLEQDAVWSRLREATPLRTVCFVHDLIPLQFPEYGRAGEAERHRRRLRNTVRNAAALIVNSQDTAQALAQFASSEALSLPPLHVAPLGIDTPAAPLQGSAHPKPYFVMLGTLEPRKNHLLLLNLWRQWIAEEGNAVPRLVLIGRRGWECEQVEDMLSRCTALRGHVEWRKTDDDDQVRKTLAGARALLFPSFAEGYGLPLAEALASGTPVLASPLPAFREIAGDIPDYLDPLDGRAWAMSLRDYARENSRPRARQVVRLRNFQAPRWKMHFRGVEDFLRTL